MIVPGVIGLEPRASDGQTYTRLAHQRFKVLFHAEHGWPWLSTARLARLVARVIHGATTLRPDAVNPVNGKIDVEDIGQR